MTASRDELLARVDSLNTPDGTYRYSAEGTTITVTDPADPQYSLAAELGNGTFRLVETKPAPITGPRRFEAGGIYNAAKRSGLRGHMPQRRRVKAELIAFLERNGWKRAP